MPLRRDQEEEAKEEEEEEEREGLIRRRRGSGLMVVVQYLESTMSKDLLCKFPDNSTFDFDYSQSSIWSPLLPRHFLPPPPPSSIARLRSFGVPTKRKLTYRDEDDEEGEVGFLHVTSLRVKQVTADIKRKISTALFSNLHNLNSQCMMLKQKMKEKEKNKKANRAFDFSPPISASAKGTSATPNPPPKGWTKVLRAATRRFKKTARRKDPTSHMKLLNCLIDVNS